MLTALWLALAATPRAQEIPFEELAREYLEALGAPTAPLQVSPSERARTFLELVRSNYHALDLGALELWIPRTTKGPKALGPGLDPGGARHWAADLVALERSWVQYSVRDRAALAERSAELDLISTWVSELDRAEPNTATRDATEAELARARKGIARVFPAGHAGGRPTILIATTRHQLVSLTSAAGLLFPSERDRLWNEEMRAVGYTNPFWEVVAVSLEAGPEPGSDGLIGARFAPGDVESTIVHRGAHILIGRALPGAPHWLREGLALNAGILLTGNDDSPCTGFWLRDQLANFTWLPLWIELDASPYREGPAAKWFRKELEPDSEGRFPIWDLDRGKIGLRLAGPFLGGDRGAEPGSDPPGEVMDAGRGVERGYAEFVRAYSATFVHWLSLQEMGGRSVLSWLIEFLRDPVRRRGLAPRDVVPTALQMITGKTFGQSADPERDLEAAFAGWLATR